MTAFGGAIRSGAVIRPVAALGVRVLAPGVVLALGLALAACSATKPPPAPIAPPPAPPPRDVPWGQHTVETRLDQVGAATRTRWMPYFRQAGLAYPGDVVEIVVFKRERRVEVYAGPSLDRLAHLRDIPITAASGGPGPKLREGDEQVPEGVYPIEALNPNSLYHLSLRIGYPNDFDRAIARAEGRKRLGGDIMLHGGDRSIGCVAVGDRAAEDLFVLAADAGKENVRVVLVPRDFRRTGESEPRPGQPAWVRNLYARLSSELRNLPPAPMASVRAR